MPKQNNEPDDPGGTLPLSFIDKGFNNWKWQLKSCIKDIKTLSNILNEKGFNISDEMAKASEHFPFSITPYYFSLIKEFSYTDPIFSMSVPCANELINPSFLKDDPLDEEHHTVVKNLVHRYSDRALLITTSMCSVYCRHCTRKRVAGCKNTIISNEELDNVLIYLKQHPEIKDVIVSGGDPLTMSDSQLENILRKLREVESIEIIRIGTRVPVVLPMRITNKLVSMISKYHPVWINTHFNHPNEITEESREACKKIVNKGIPLGNQSVLLRGINDNSNVMIELCRKLISMRVRPYYLYQCDLVKGVEHFRTPVEDGIQIMEEMRGRISGIGIPSFIIDAPEGKGKIPLLPNYIVNKNQDEIILRNYKNEIVSYPETS